MKNLSKSFIIIIISITLLLIYLKLPQEKIIYVSPDGRNQNGELIEKPYLTIQYAVDKATSGSTIKILPGVYRESIILSKSGTQSSPIKITAEQNSKGKVIIAGSEPSSSMSWNKCSSQTCKEIPRLIIENVYHTVLNWKEIPYLIYEKTEDGEEHELHIARSPNFSVTTDWKYHEHWWTASDSAISQFNLVDKKNLNVLEDLTGSTIYMMDGAKDRCGIFLYKRTVNSHDIKQGRLLFDEPVGFSIFGSQENGIGPFTKYYIEGKEQLLDSPGEWVYNPQTKKLYLWPLEEGNPGKLSIEIGKRANGVYLQDASNVEIDGLSFKYMNDSAIKIYSNPEKINKNISIRNTEIKQSTNGIIANAYNKSSKIENIDISNTKISEISDTPISFIASETYPSNIQGILVKNSEIFNSALHLNNSGMIFVRTNKVDLSNNYIHDLASVGIYFSSYEKENKVTNEITVTGNTIERVCLNGSSCSSIKFFGGNFGNTNVYKNILRDNKGWSFCQEASGNKGWAHGLWISNASGVKASNNFSYNHTGSAYQVYSRQIPATKNQFINNLAWISSVGLSLVNPRNAYDYDMKVSATRHDNSIIKNNIFMGNDVGLQVDPANPEKVYIDNNAYIENKVNNTFTDKVSFQWNKNSIITTRKSFKNADKFDFNLSYFSPLRGKGEPQFNNPFLQFQLDLFGLSNDIGPCKFRWISDSCPILN